MKYTAYRIPADPDQPIEISEYDDERPESLIELVNLTADDTLSFTTFRAHGVQLVYDDMGLLKTDPEPELNLRAMAVWAGLAGREIKDFVQPLVGDYGVIGVDVYGEPAPVPEEFIAALTTLEAHRG